MKRNPFAKLDKFMIACGATYLGLALPYEAFSYSGPYPLLLLAITVILGAALIWVGASDLAWPECLETAQ